MNKIKLTKEKRIILIGVLIAVILGVYLISFIPLMKELRTRYPESKSIENNILEVRNIIEAARGTDVKRTIIAEDDASRAISEVTGHGRLNGINFISINPGNIKKEEGLRYKILPLETKIKSTYEQIGIFLGSLDELEKTLVTVKSFKISPDKEGPSKLTANLVIYIYLLESENAE